MPKAEYLKFFTGDTGAMVALFTSDHGWITNLPAQAVFISEVPSGLSYEEMLPISEFQVAQFNSEFASSFTDISTEPPKGKAPSQRVLIEQIVANSSRDLGLPPEQMQKFTREIFSRMRSHLSAGLSLHSPYVTVTPADSKSPNSIMTFS